MIADGSQPWAGVQGSAQGVAEALERNERLAPDSEAWKSEPPSNFERNPDGSVMVRPDGRPVRVSRRPRRAKKGDDLAGGGVLGDDKPGQATGTVVTEPRPAPDPPAVTMTRLPSTDVSMRSSPSGQPTRISC